MKVKYSLILWTFVLFALTSCNNSNNLKEKELELKEKELMLREQELKSKNLEPNESNISTNDAVRIAENQFRKYLPKILESHEAILDLQQSYTGDFTGDGIEDIAIYFSLAPREGGNAIVGQGLSLYQNNGISVKVIAGYEPDYLFSFDKISGGNIYVEKLEYAENDGRCCPSIKTEHIITISGSEAF
jgi:hypothetical protein